MIGFLDSCEYRPEVVVISVADRIFQWHRFAPTMEGCVRNGLRVKLLHSFYRSDQPSGENEAVLQQVDLLAQAGFRVELISLSSDDLQESRLGRYAAAMNLAVGTPAAVPPHNWLEDADILHIHNTFPSMSTSWLSTIDIPKVISVHNYRAFCANGLFLRDGSRCMECTTHGVGRGLIHGCYRNSRLQTLPITLQQSSKRSLKHLLAVCDRVLVPGKPMQDIFSKLGISNTTTLHHPVMSDVEPDQNHIDRGGWLFAGRLSSEKGIGDLLQIWPDDEPLLIVGDGPDRDISQMIATDRGLMCEFVGSLPNREVREIMTRSRGLIFPSNALEGAPLVYGEAMQAGLPIIATNGTTLATQAQLDGTGAVFSQHDERSLRDAIALVSSQRERLSDKARSIYFERYTPEVWLQQITDIYRSAVESHQSIE